MNIADVTLAAGTFLTSTAITTGSDDMTTIIAAGVSALIFGLCNLAGKIVIAILEKKKIISSDTADKLEDDLNDLTDDGKLNDSNKENK